MQLQEILSLLKTTPTNVMVIEIFALILMICFVMLALKETLDRNLLLAKIFSSLCALSILFGFATLFYAQASKNIAIKEAKVTRSDNKIHIESNSEFMKSAELDIVSEKDGYIIVEFENKTYRIADLSKKGN